MWPLCMSRLFGFVCFGSCNEVFKRHHIGLFVFCFIDKRVVKAIFRVFYEDGIINRDESGKRLAVLGDDDRFVGVSDAGDSVSQAVTQMKQGNGIEVFQSFLVRRV